MKSSSRVRVRHGFVVFPKKYSSKVFAKCHVMVTSYGCLSMVEVRGRKAEKFIEQELVPIANDFEEILVVYQVNASVPESFETVTAEDNTALHLYVWKEILEATGRLEAMCREVSDVLH